LRHYEAESKRHNQPVERIGKIEDLEALVLPKIQKLAAQIRTALAHDVVEAGPGLDVLTLLRRIAQEETNQILHEAMLLVAARWLINNRFKNMKLVWNWNPRQSGGATEPDLQATLGRRVLVSAEATTSAEPKGKIDQRMAETLRKLSGMRGAKYYFVATAEMHRRAETKIRREHYKIRVVTL
jgi:hypothetical protein